MTTEGEESAWRARALEMAAAAGSCAKSRVGADGGGARVRTAALVQEAWRAEVADGSCAMVVRARRLRDGAGGGCPGRAQGRA